MIVVYAETTVAFRFGFFSSTDGAAAVLRRKQLIVLLQRHPVTFYDAIGAFFWIVAFTPFQFTDAGHVRYLVRASFDLIARLAVARVTMSASMPVVLASWQIPGAFRTDVRGRCAGRNLAQHPHARRLHQLAEKMLFSPFMPALRAQ